MNVGHDWNGTLSTDIAKAPQRLFGWDRNAHYIAPRLGEFSDLFQGGTQVNRRGTGHGLNNDGRSPAYGDVAYVHRACQVAWNKISHMCSLEESKDIGSQHVNE